MSKDNGLVKPLRISTALDAEVKRVAADVGLSESDVMRKSMEHGLGVLEKLLRSPLRKRLSGKRAKVAEEKLAAA